MKNTSITLTAALALASGAYALGTEAGDGSAVARNTVGTAGTAAAGPPGPEPQFAAGGRAQHLDELAAKLGVEPSKLKAALDELHPRGAGARPGPPDELVKALADGLNLPTDKVTAALEKLRPDRAGRRAERLGHRAHRFDGFAAALGTQLGVDSAKVSAALKKVAGAGRPGPRHREPGAFVDALAKELGVAPAKLRAALRKARPAHGPTRLRLGPPAAALAKELGVETAAVRKVLAEFRAGMPARMEAKREEFVKQLAQKLGISEEKVRDALPEGPRGGPRFHRHP